MIASPVGPEWWAAAFAGLAAFAAIWQVRVQVRQSRRHTTFVHIRQVAERLHKLSGRDARPYRAELLALYRSEKSDLSEEAGSFLALLDEVDLLALAHKYHVVDRSLVLEYFKSLLRDPYFLSEAFIKELQVAVKDPTIYEHTIHLLSETRGKS